MQVQASEYNSGNKVTISSPSLPAEPISDINLPVAIRKWIRECTKHQFYVLKDNYYDYYWRLFIQTSY